MVRVKYPKNAELSAETGNDKKLVQKRKIATRKIKQERVQADQGISEGIKKQRLPDQKQEDFVTDTELDLAMSYIEEQLAMHNTNALQTEPLNLTMNNTKTLVNRAYDDIDYTRNISENSCKVGYDEVGYVSNMMTPKKVTNGNQDNTSSEKFYSWNAINRKIMLPLLSPITYYLNRSKSKWVTVGLHIENNFEPVVRLSGTRNQSLTLDLPNWKLITDNIKTINSHFDDTTNRKDKIHLNGLTLSYDVLDSSTKVIKMDNGCEYIYLSYETLRELWRFEDVINCRMAYLEDLHYAQYYFSCVDMIATNPGGDIADKMRSLCNNTATDYTCITTELLLFGIDRIKSDIDLLNTVKTTLPPSNGMQKSYFF